MAEITELDNNTTFDSIVRKLMAMPNCTRLNNIRIKNVNTEKNEDNDSVRITLTVIPKLPAYIQVLNPDTGEFERKLGESNIVYTSNFAIAGMMKENEEQAWIANSIVTHPSLVNLLMNGGQIDIIQHTVPAGENYHNPFTTRDNPQDTVFNNEKIINYVVAFRFGKTGEKFADKLADKLMSEI